MQNNSKKENEYKAYNPYERLTSYLLFIIFINKPSKILDKIIAIKNDKIFINNISRIFIIITSFFFSPNVLNIKYKSRLVCKSTYEKMKIIMSNDNTNKVKKTAPIIFYSQT